MEMILAGIVIVLLLVSVLALTWYYYVSRRLRKLALKKYMAFHPLIEKLVTGGEVNGDEILLMAKDPSTRHVVFGILVEHGRQDLFPVEYFTREKGAESFLVTWLEFPTELGIPPDEIDFLTKVTLDESEGVEYFVFKYRTKHPHWMAKNNWMIGVSGPYGKDSAPYDVPLKVFSRFKLIDTIEPDAEARWVHYNIGQQVQ